MLKFQVAAAGLLVLSVYVLIKAEDILGFSITGNLSADNPTAVQFSILLVRSMIKLCGFLLSKAVYRFIHLCKQKS